MIRSKLIKISFLVDNFVHRTFFTFEEVDNKDVQLMQEKTLDKLLKIFIDESIMKKIGYLSDNFIPPRLNNFEKNQIWDINYFYEQSAFEENDIMENFIFTNTIENLFEITFNEL